MSKPIKIKGYLPIIQPNQTPADILKKDVWVFDKDKPETPYFQIEVTVVNYEKQYSHYRDES